MSKAKDPHPVRIILQDWTKTNKANCPIVAETHTRKEVKKK